VTFPTVQSARRAFPPPVPTTELPDPGGDTPHARAYNRQRQVAEDYTNWRASHSPDILPDDLKANAGAYANSAPARQLAPALRDAEADTAQANDRLSDALDGQTVAPEQENRARRVWDRYVRLLDSKSGPAQVSAAARDLVASADPADIPVLREELPAYLDAKQAPRDWLPAALAAKVPAAAQAAAEAKLKAKQLDMLRSNHARLTNSIVKDVDAPPLFDPSTVSTDDYVNPTLG
jgi:hypothetical protein